MIKGTERLRTGSMKTDERFPEVAPTRSIVTLRDVEGPRS
jgi:hypothetical protein